MWKAQIPSKLIVNASVSADLGIYLKSKRINRKILDESLEFVTMSKQKMTLSHRTQDVLKILEVLG